MRATLLFLVCDILKANALSPSNSKTTTGLGKSWHGSIPRGAQFTQSPHSSSGLSRTKSRVAGAVCAALLSFQLADSPAAALTGSDATIRIPPAVARPHVGSHLSDTSVKLDKKSGNTVLDTQGESLGTVAGKYFFLAYVVVSCAAGAKEIFLRARNAMGGDDGA